MDIKDRIKLFFFDRAPNSVLEDYVRLEFHQDPRSDIDTALSALESDGFLVSKAHRIPLLELFVGDVQKDEFGFVPVELVFAGLLFEYVDADAVLAKIRSMLCPDGTLLTVVQLPSTTIAKITPSRYASLGALSSAMRLVPPKLLGQLAAAHGYHEIDAQTLKVAGGKEFQVQAFRLATPNHRLQSTPASGRA